MNGPSTRITLSMILLFWDNLWREEGFLFRFNKRVRPVYTEEELTWVTTCLFIYINHRKGNGSVKSILYMSLDGKISNDQRRTKVDLSFLLVAQIWVYEKMVENGIYGSFFNLRLFYYLKIQNMKILNSLYFWIFIKKDSVVSRLLELRRFTT